MSYFPKDRRSLAPIGVPPIHRRVEVRRFDPYNNKLYTLDEWIKACIGVLPNVSILEEQWLELDVWKKK